MNILMVCLGNICRSPTAEAAVRRAAADVGVDVQVWSAGTGAYHVGSPPDRRMAAAAAESGLPLAGKAAQVSTEDIEAADLVLAMDRSNLEELRRLAPQHTDRMRLFRTYDPEVAEGEDVPDVPDPYYGGPDGFANVVTMIRRTADALVESLGGDEP